VGTVVYVEAVTDNPAEQPWRRATRQGASMRPAGEEPEEEEDADGDGNEGDNESLETIYIVDVEPDELAERFGWDRVGRDRTGASDEDEEDSLDDEAESLESAEVAAP